MKIKTGEAVKTSDTLLKDYADNWLETYKASASINTKAMYINAINCHIKPEIGHLPLNKIVRSDIQNTFYLFPGKNTETLSKTQYVKMWERIVKKMNAAATTDKEKEIGAEPISGLTAHIFRHNYCTMLYYSGISQKKAVELMGHSDLKMIMEVYAHLDEEKEAVQEKLNNAIAL